MPNGSTLSPESPAADADNTKSIGATPLAGDSWPAGTNGQVESTVSGASLPHLPLIFEPNESAASPREPEKSTELLEMVELSESTAGKRKTGNGKADSRKWFRNKNKGYCVSTKKNTDGEFEESAPRLMGSRCQPEGLRERCKLPLLRGPGRSSGRKRIWCTPELSEMVATI